jgi:hypothetical protein
VKYYEKERVQCCKGLQDKAQKLLYENEVLETLFDPSSVTEDHRDQSLTDLLQRPYADWEGTSTRTQTPCLINFESGEPQEQVNVYFQSLATYLCPGSPLQDNTELADCHYSLLV